MPDVGENLPVEEQEDVQAVEDAEEQEAPAEEQAEEKEEPAGEPEAVEAEVLDAPLEAGEQDIEPEPPETRRYVQFVFDEKMMEFEVDWSSEQLVEAIDNCTKDDGFLWIPKDEESDTGTFVNLNNCTGVVLAEREVPKPFEPPADTPMEAPQPTEEELAAQEADRQEAMARECASYLDQVAVDGALPKRPSFREKSADSFWEALISAKFPDLDDPDQVYMAWIEGAYDGPAQAE